MKTLVIQFALLLTIISLSGSSPAQVRALGKPTSVDWPTFLFSPTHSSATSSNAITKANATSLIEAWHFQAGAPTMNGQPKNYIWSSPVVSNGSVFVGADTGVFYALNANNGQEIWEQFLGFRPKMTCNNIGIAATATVATDPVTQKLTVYAPGGDGYLYAMDAASGTVNWKSVIALPSGSQNDYFNWSSPNIVNGKIYVGVSSQCDNPLTDNTGVEEFDQVSGNLLNQYYTIRPSGYEGASVLSSVAVTSDSVFVATGNGRRQGYPDGVTADSISVVRLDPNSMAKLDIWHLQTKPGADQDFGCPPIVFTATINGKQTEMVGVSNKDGYFYALISHNLAAGPVWQWRVSQIPITPTVAAATWDGTNLYVAGNQIKIGGTLYQGSINKLDPSTGKVLWQTPLESAVVGSPSINGSGVLAVTTFESFQGVPTKGAANGTYLIDSSSGSILDYISLNDDYEWSQPTFAGNDLLTAKHTDGLFAYTPSSVLLSDGFESGNLSKWSVHSNVVVEKTLVKDGTYAAEATATGNGGAFAHTAITPGPDVTMNTYFYMKSYSTMVNLLTFKDANGKMLFTVFVNAKGFLGSTDGTNNKSAYSPIAVTSNAWHQLQVHLADSATGQTSVRLDGQWIAVLSQNQPFSGVAAKTVQFGDSSAKHVFDVVYDDVSVQAPALQ